MHSYILFKWQFFYSQDYLDTWIKDLWVFIWVFFLALDEIPNKETSNLLKVSNLNPLLLKTQQKILWSRAAIMFYLPNPSKRTWIVKTSLLNPILLSICTGILGIFDIRQFQISSLIFFLVWTGKKFQLEISS